MSYYSENPGDLFHAFRPFPPVSLPVSPSRAEDTNFLSKVLDTAGAFHYAKLTDQRLLGIPEENGTTFPD